MPVIINGTTGISGVDGSAATPAIEGGDTNTGMFFPAADTIAFAEGGVESMRLDSNGNVGIGISSPTARLEVNGLVRARATGGEGGEIRFATPDNSADGLFCDVQTATVSRVYQTQNNSQLILGQLSGTGGIVSVQTEAVERLRVAANGQLSAVVPGGSTLFPAFTARAWVNFNGTGTVAIRASGNVTSITDNDVGTYTLNFTTAMPSANYAIMGGATFPGNSIRTAICGPTEGGVRTTTAARVLTANTGTQTLLDSADVMVAVFV